MAFGTQEDCRMWTAKTATTYTHVAVCNEQEHSCKCSNSNTAASGSIFIDSRGHIRAHFEKFFAFSPNMVPSVLSHKGLL